LENAGHNNQSIYTKFDLPFAFTEAHKKGYEFTGWYEDALFANKITSIPDGSKKNYDIYAKWGSPTGYSITYGLDGGINNPANPTKYTIESNKITFESPKKTGANFVAWYSDKELTKKISGIPSGSIGDTTIYARWELDIFDIQYMLNGGNNNKANPAQYTIDSDNVIFKSPSKVGANFVAWYSDKNLINKISEIPKGSIGDTTIYAKWELDIFDIQYELYSGKNNLANPEKYTIESASIIFKSPSKTGAKFIAWYRDKSLVNKITEIPKGSIGDTTLYAKWELDTFDIQYSLQGGSNNPANPAKYTIDSDKIIFKSPSKIGSKFIAWCRDKNLINKITEIPKGSVGDTIIYAKWELDTFDIQYVLDGGNNSLANPPKYTFESTGIVFKSPSKTGAKFIAWCRDKALLNKITEIPNGSIGDTTIYAKWELDTFDIQYVLNGGNNNPANPYQYTIESGTITFKNPDRTGFIFDGWFTNSNYTDSIGFIPKGSVSDITIYARWLEIFDVNFIITTDGVNPAPDIDIVFNKTKILRSDNLGLADTLMPDRSSFDYSIEINGIVIDDGSVTVSGKDVTIKAEIVNCYLRWYDVIFCDNGKGLWTDFNWDKDNIRNSDEQFFHNPGGIKEGQYRLVLKSVAGVEYVWEKEYKANEPWVQPNESDSFEMSVFPNPITRGSNLNIILSENINLQTAHVLIYNVNGALIAIINNPLYMNEFNIDTKFSSGLYHVVLTDDKNKRRTVKNFTVY
jgi:uncharacterized repeat protein (TIGR02543 family)